MGVVMPTSLPSVPSLLTLVLAGCTGLTLGENVPGGDRHVEPDDPLEGEHLMGSLAIEADGERAWAVHVAQQDGVEVAHLSMIDPETGATREVMDVSGTRDRRVTFPADDRMLLFAEQAGRDHLVLFDTRTQQALRSTVAPTWYHGTRSSPSGALVAVADNAGTAGPLHLIDSGTLEVQPLGDDGAAIEAQWNHGDDRLLAVSSDDPFGGGGVRIARYDLTSGLGAPPPELRIDLPDLGWDIFFSFTWIGVSPDDRWAVFPLLRGDENVLVILDQASGDVAVVPGRGPVGFTPDGQLIVSYGYDEETWEAELWLIDPVSEARAIVPLGFVDGVSFYVSRGGNQVLASPIYGVWDGTPSVHHDLDTATTTRLDRHVDLTALVYRPSAEEAWSQRGGRLERVALAEPLVTTIPSGDEVASLAIRVDADELLTGERDPVVHRIDLTDLHTIGAPIWLPDPLSAAAPPLPTSARLTGAGAGGARRAQSRFDPAFVGPTPSREGAVTAPRE